MVSKNESDFPRHINGEPTLAKSNAKRLTCISPCDPQNGPMKLALWLDPFADEDVKLKEVPVTLHLRCLKHQVYSFLYYYFF